jgi:8-oxo-dGTP pyrophosphatase MutT (NUDIX family)
MTDITINVNGYRVNLRVGAIVRRDDKVLVCRARDKDWWYLPGGRIKTNESSLEALTRELKEEIGTNFRIDQPVVCSENFFEEDGNKFHELCTYYQVEWLGSEIVNEHNQAFEVFAWVDRKYVTALDLRPSFIKAHIVNPSPHLELVIYRDGEQDIGTESA